MWKMAEVRPETQALVLATIVGCGARTGLGGGQVDASTVLDAQTADACAPILSDAGCAPSSCNGGVCTSIPASGPIRDLIVDGTNLYWAMDGAVMKSSLCGADTVSLAMCVAPVLLAKDANDIYFAEQSGTEEHITSSVSRVSKAGGSVVKLASFVIERVLALALNATDLYLSLATNEASGGRIVRVASAGGADTTLFSGFVDQGLAVDDDFLFWDTLGGLMRAKHDGSDQMKLADTFLGVVSAQGANSLTLDSEFVYWSGGCGAVARVPRDALAQVSPVLVGSVAQDKGVVCTSDDAGRQLGVDATNVYMTFVGNLAVAGGLFRMPKSGGDVVQLAVDTSSAGSIALDSTTIYWADQSSIRSMTPK